MQTAVAVAATACKQEIVQETPLQVENGGSIENHLMVSEDAAGNSRCHVCHINYDEEILALNHELASVSCQKCHGSSDTSSYRTVGLNDRETFRGGRVKVS